MSNPATRRISVGCHFEYLAEVPTPAIFQVQPNEDALHTVMSESWLTKPAFARRSYRDLYGNRCQWVLLPAGPSTVNYEAIVEVPNRKDDVETSAPERPVSLLPTEALMYTMPSRYCLSDELGDEAWRLFGSVDPGWNRVQQICDFVHDRLTFRYGSSTPVTTAVDVYNSCEGVCRDFAHLAITFCRALNIPARYVFGYIPDIDVPPSDAPMDFCAWFEAYLGDRWWPFDARNNTPRLGRTLIGRGRDALDVAMVTTYGGPQLQVMNVWADDAPMGALV